MLLNVATSARYVIFCFKLTIQISNSKKKILWNEVKKYRFDVLENKQARKKARIAAVISYGGQYLMKRVYDWNEKQQVKV